MENNKINSLFEYLDKIPDGAMLKRYITWLDNLFDNEYISREFSESKEKKPFLSVIIYTQGECIEGLREALLCLCGQNDQDFEVLLIGNGLEDERIHFVKEVIDEQPDFIKTRIKYFEVILKNRAEALNYGFAQANGQFISIMNEKDIVMDNWIDSFRAAANKNAECILYAQGYYQKWSFVGTTSNVLGLCSTKKPDGMVYSKKFDLMQQLRCNNCSDVGIAFPSYIFHKLGLILDKTLSTDETWDYLMRCASIFGVYSIEESTAILRDFAEIDVSKSYDKEHSGNKLRIMDRLLSMPILLPSGEKKAISYKDFLELQEEKWSYRTPNAQAAALYFDYGHGFNQEDSVTAGFLIDKFHFSSNFYLSSQAASKQIKSIRFDPGEEGQFIIQSVTAIMEYADGSKEARNLAGTITNGMAGTNQILFIKDDPWIIWNNIKKSLVSVRIIGDITARVTDEDIRDIKSHRQNIDLKSKLKQTLKKVKYK